MALWCVKCHNSILTGPVIFGPPDTPYFGGVFHGKIKFPSEFPHKPPGILMCTPNGRFAIDTQLCLSMSNFHPESWNPMWSVASILTGLLSFMLEDKITTGSIETSVDEKLLLATRSMDFNRSNPVFQKNFPELLDEQQFKKIKEEAMAPEAAPEVVIETETIPPKSQSIDNPIKDVEEKKETIEVKPTNKRKKKTENSQPTTNEPAGLICFVCKGTFPKTEYSNAQLKNKGKRKCKGCVIPPSQLVQKEEQIEKDIKPVLKEEEKKEEEKEK